MTGAIVTVDLLKKDSEVKLLIGCTPVEAETAWKCQNDFSQAGLLVIRA